MCMSVQTRSSISDLDLHRIRNLFSYARAGKTLKGHSKIAEALGAPTDSVRVRLCRLLHSEGLAVYEEGEWVPNSPKEGRPALLTLVTMVEFEDWEEARRSRPHLSATQHEILDHMTQAGGSWLDGQAVMAEKIGKGRSTVERAWKGLVDMGLIIDCGRPQGSHNLPRVWKLNESLTNRISVPRGNTLSKNPETYTSVLEEGYPAEPFAESLAGYPVGITDPISEGFTLEPVCEDRECFWWSKAHEAECWHRGVWVETYRPLEPWRQLEPGEPRDEEGSR